MKFSWIGGSALLMALVAVTLVFGPAPAGATERLLSEKRLVGQSDSYEECAVKLIKVSAAMIAAVYVRGKYHPDESFQFLVTARPHDLSMTFDLVTPGHEGMRTVSTCDNETNILREYAVDAAVPLEPAAPDLRQIRSHVMDTFPTHDRCIADLLSVSTLALGVEAFQDEETANRTEMRLTFSKGQLSTESRQQEHDGIWTVTSTSCVGGRETVLNLTSEPAPASGPSRPSRRTR